MPSIMVSVFVARLQQTELRCTGCRAARRRSASASDWPMRVCDPLASSSRSCAACRRRPRSSSSCCADLRDAQLAVAADLGDAVGQPLAVRRETAAPAGGHRLELVVVRRLERGLRLRGSVQPRRRVQAGVSRTAGRSHVAWRHLGTSEEDTLKTAHRPFGRGCDLRHPPTELVRDPLALSARSARWPNRATPHTVIALAEVRSTAAVSTGAPRPASDVRPCPRNGRSR